MIKETRMRKHKKIFLMGLLLLIVGLLLKFALPDSNTDNLAIAKQAQSAQEAAVAIASNNQGDVLTNSIAMFLLGLGGVLSVVGGLKLLTGKSA